MRDSQRGESMSENLSHEGSDTEILGLPVVEVDGLGVAGGITLGPGPLDAGYSLPLGEAPRLAPEPEIEVVGQGRPDGPATVVEIEAHGRQIRVSLPPGLEPGQVQAMVDRMAQAAEAMTYVPGPDSHDLPMYQAAITDLAGLWGLPWDEAQQAFSEWVKATVYSWPQAYWLAKARAIQGDTEPPKAEREV